MAKPTKHPAQPSKFMQAFMSRAIPVSRSNRRKARDCVLRVCSNIADGTATKVDIDEAGHAGALYEALARYRYAPLDVDLCMAFEAARQAALRRGKQLGKYALNPSELETIKQVLFNGLLPAMEQCPEPVFFKIDAEVIKVLTGAVV